MPGISLGKFSGSSRRERGTNEKERSSFSNLLRREVRFKRIYFHSDTATRPCSMFEYMHTCLYVRVVLSLTGK